MISLIGGIILLIVGIILFAISRALPHPSAATAAYWIGIALAILGVIFIAIALILGIPSGGPYWYDWDMLSAYQPVLQKL
jgi:hypothetical protein